MHVQYIICLWFASFKESSYLPPEGFEMTSQVSTVSPLSLYKECNPVDVLDGYLQMAKPISPAQSSRIFSPQRPAISRSQGVCDTIRPNGDQQGKFTHQKKQQKILYFLFLLKAKTETSLNGVLF